MLTDRSGGPNPRLAKRTISRRDFLARGAGLGLSLGVMGSVLAACGGDSEESQATAKEISLWHGWTGADNTDMLNTVLDKFNEENEGGLTLKPTALEWDQLFSKLVVSAASGKAPNVTMYHTSEVPEFASRGVTLPLDDLLKDAGLTFEGVPESALEATRWEGETHAVVGDLHPMAMYYNVEMVEKAGLDPGKPPKTGEELLSWAKELTIEQPSGEVEQYGISMPSRASALPRWFWWSILHQNGGSFLNSRGESAVDSPESRAALQFLVDLYYRHGVAQPNVTEDADQVARKKAAIWFVGPWDVNNRMRQKLDFDTAPMPVIGDRPAAWANTHAQALPRQRDDSKYEASMAFVEWFFRNYALPAKVVGVIPVAEASRQSEEFIQDKRYEYYEAFISELDYVALEPSIPQYTRIFSFAKPTPLSTNLEAALSRSKSVEQALEDMKKGIDEQLAQDI